MNEKFKKLLRDVSHVLFFVVIVYFFVLGALFFFNEKTMCDFTQTDIFGGTVYNYSTRIDLVGVRVFVNTTGLFDNGYVLSDKQFLSNCSFSFKN